MYHKSADDSPGIDFNAPALKKYRARRFLKDQVARWAVAAGGVSVILAILLIFFYLLGQVVPLFNSAGIAPIASYPSDSAQFLALDDRAEMAMAVENSGSLRFFVARTGLPLFREPLPVPSGATIAHTVKDAGSSLLAAGLNNGNVIIFSQGYRLSWPDDQRQVTPEIRYPFGSQPLIIDDLAGPLTGLAISDGNEKLLVAASVDDQLKMVALHKNKNVLTGNTAINHTVLALPPVTGPIRQLLIDPQQTWLYVLSGNNRLTVINIGDTDQPRTHQTLALSPAGVKVTSMVFLHGGVSVLVGDSRGAITQWFMVRNGGDWKLHAARTFELGTAPVEHIVPEQRRKGFLAADVSGRVGLFYTTANRTLLTEPLAAGPIDRMAVSPAGDYLLLNSDGDMQFLAIDNKHPEISWSALWDKVWYESYPAPGYLWQSSTPSDGSEAKLSLVPLSFGTLKAAFYAMLLATPLALAAAIYTAYFTAPALRRKVKPLIELMAALPTVILGFLAGLWLAPLIEQQLIGIFALLLFVPVGILLFALCWDHLAPALPDGTQALLLVPVVLTSSALAIKCGASLESWLFAGDASTWLTTQLGIPFQQRNALVVGLAMGFAVIPTIFSIAEDAIYSVPRHLTYGSLALGATPWQTLTRVVLPTASPGIFSAVMIGMSRAVGETMIVLMVAGNTPIMETNLFQGMRTLAANIAVEMPKSVVGSTHYRLLFLTALVLFLFTFVVNGVVEVVRHRLRKKYGSL